MVTLKKILLLGVALTSFPAVAEEGPYSFSAGADFTSGDYGTGISSDVWSMPLGLSYAGERFAWSVSVPYLIITAPEGFVFSGGAGLQLNGSDSTTGTMGLGATGGTGSGPVAIAAGAITGSDQTTRTVSGLGDVSASLTMQMVQEGDLIPWLALTGKAKIATADPDENLGTGEHDLAAQLEWAKGPVNGYFGQKWLGDTSTTDFRDVLYGAVAMTYVGDEGGDLGVEFYVEEAALVGSENRRELTLYGSYSLDSNLRLQAYVLKGLSDGSPDIGAGLAVKYAL